jgi:hypothetical protein
MCNKIIKAFHKLLRSCEVRMIEELPAAVATLRIHNDHFAQNVELNLVHQLQGLRPI